MLSVVCQLHFIASVKVAFENIERACFFAEVVSGQIQHIAGMQDAGIIISVNSDPNAPINTIADYVINGTVEEVVPKLIKYYKKNSK